ncbi:hypothetical protein [Aurantiacibacter sp. MUD61]|uniref:hypothetical protein n=1 Tax=Aurantiacibacter sp. MUD61 TaxID=3009083 RepID=UPI0022F124F7|nr:hypothetical protein [Aurantiacibacter sp. MUD61]
MIYILQNILPIGAATLAGLVLGWLWLRLSGRATPRAGIIALAAIAIFWLAAILAGALILAPQQAGVWAMTIGSAVVIWCGFVLPALAVTLAVGGARGKAITSAATYWLLAMLAMAAIMRLVGLTAPPA